MPKIKSSEQTFGERLQKAIEARGVTQAWVATETEVPLQTIFRYYTGQTFPESLIIARKMAKVLNVSIDYLVGLTDEMRPAKFVEQDVSEFERKYRHNFQNADFQMYVDVYDRLPPKSKAFLVEFVRAYGINRNVLGPDGKTPDMPIEED